jgi:hypothetical protein
MLRVPCESAICLRDGEDMTDIAQQFRAPLDIDAASTVRESPARGCARDSTPIRALPTLTAA